MSSSSDKIKGAANEALGNIKQGVGKVVGSPDLEAEGIIQERKGEAQQTLGSVKEKAQEVVDDVSSSSAADTAKGLANKAVGKAKQVVGSIVGSPSLEAEGIAQKTKGEVQKAVGSAKRAID